MKDSINICNLNPVKNYFIKIIFFVVNLCMMQFFPNVSNDLMLAIEILSSYKYRANRLKLSLAKIIKCLFGIC